MRYCFVLLAVSLAAFAPSACSLDRTGNNEQQGEAGSGPLLGGSGGEAGSGQLLGGSGGEAGSSGGAEYAAVGGGAGLGDAGRGLAGASAANGGSDVAPSGGAQAGGIAGGGSGGAAGARITGGTSPTGGTEASGGVSTGGTGVTGAQGGMGADGGSAAGGVAGGDATGGSNPAAGAGGAAGEGGLAGAAGAAQCTEDAQCDNLNGDNLCLGGVCVPDCDPGWGSCDGDNVNGCETDLNTDPDHCGQCSRACASSGVATRICSGGLCTSTCTGLLGNCDQPPAPGADNGCETDLSADCSPCNCVTETFGENLVDHHREVTQDTYLSEESSTLNYGSSDLLIFDGDPECRLLIQFDLSVIAGSTVVDAALHLVADGGSRNTSEVFPVLRPWVQGSGDAEAGTPNWEYVEPGLAWDALGPGAPDAVAVGSVTPTGLGSTEHVIPIDRVTVQGWVDGSLQNNGLVVINSAGIDGAYIYSSESLEGQRPFLQITYVPQ